MYFNIHLAPVVTTTTQSALLLNACPARYSFLPALNPDPDPRPHHGGLGHVLDIHYAPELRDTRPGDSPARFRELESHVPDLADRDVRDAEGVPDPLPRLGRLVITEP